MRIGEFTGRRLKVRVVDEDRALGVTLEKAKASGIPRIHCCHGGTVANKYGYPAETEGLLTIAFPDGRSLQILTRVRANKATLGGAAEACSRLAGAPNARPLFDDRYRRHDSKQPARKALLEWAGSLIPVTKDTDPAAIQIDLEPLDHPFEIQIAC